MKISAELPEAGRSQAFWAVWAVVAAFGTYFCMYAFRKPFTAAGFEGASALGLSLKVVLVSSQVLGYTVSKFLGIKIVAEMPPQRRAGGILVLVAIAEAALVLFGLLPTPWNAAGLFINGLALGMVFGLVIGFLEGRQLTEALAAGLCASFILADGVTKSVGAWLLTRGVSEYWMPATAGLLFLAPLALGTWMLSRLPPPTAADVAARASRGQLNRNDRWSLLASFAGGLLPLLAMYLIVTILRSIRADFAREIWTSLGSNVPPALFTQSEIFVALGVLAVSGSSVLIRDNRRAFFASLGICAGGFLLVCGALLTRKFGALSGFAFVVLVGLGLYLPYVAVHTTIFERLLAMTRQRGNVGFLMQVADAVGYLSYIPMMVLSEVLKQSTGNVLQFFTLACWLGSGISLVCLILCWRYFAVRCPASEPAAAIEAAA